MAAGFQTIDQILHADGVALARIADTCGTPCYVYSSSQLDQNVEGLKSAMRRALPASDQPLIAFACKANSNLGILHHMAGLGLGADVVSGGEMIRAQAAGIDPARIIFSGVGKTDEDIEQALRAHIAQINIESAPELERVTAIAQHIGITARIAFRLNPDVDAQTHAKITTGKEDNKFGLAAQDIAPLYRHAVQRRFVDVLGLSVHIGSQLTSLEPFREAFSKTAAFARQLVADGLPLRSLDLGGGLGIVYDREQAPCLDGYASLIRELILPLGVKIILEPGRLLVGNAGLLLTRVTYIKKTSTRQYLVLDAGMNDLVRPALYDAWHEIRPVVDNATNNELYDVVGPVCETGDTFARDRALPPLQAGTLLAIMNAGAYGFSMSSRYNARPLPAEVMTRNGHFRVIRQRENVRDILKEETIPAW